MSNANPYLDMPWASPVGSPPVAPAARLARAQDLTYNAQGGQVVYSTAVGSATVMVRLCVPPSGVNTGVRVAIGPLATVLVTAASALLTPGMVEYFKCSPGDVVGAISADGSTGFVNVVECASVLFPQLF